MEELVILDTIAESARSLSSDKDITLFQRIHRILRKGQQLSGSSMTSSTATVTPAAWKAAMWDRQSTEPAMLRVPVVIIVFVFLWAMNLWLLERNRMQYLPTLSIKSAPILFSIVSSASLLLLYAATISGIAPFFSWPTEQAVAVYYGAVFILFLMYSACGTTGQETKSSLVKLIKLCFFPGSSISFSEVLFADALTSLSKVFKDVAVTLIAAYAHLTGKDVASLHDYGMLLVAIFASFPFWVRVRQCWVQYDSVGDKDPAARTPILLNIGKYLSAFPPIWIACAASLGYYSPNLPFLSTATMAFNSLYSFAWDFVMDWGLISYSKATRRVSFRTRCLWPLPSYVIAAIVNLVLRFSWASQRLPFLATLHASHLVLAVEVLEVCRRAMWNFFRIEWEVIVQQDRQAANSRI